MKEPFLWWRDGVIYQIYPRSFADSSGDGVGDLNGITQRLDYLKELSVDALWLSPIYPSPDVDFGYDISDYQAIDPRYGSMADFDQLVQQAHARGIHIVLDLVLNHTSDQHAWFQASRASRDNAFRDYYIWRDPKSNGAPPNNWLSAFGGGGWQADPATGQSYFHMFYPAQPDLNWRNPAVRQAMLGVFRFWLDRGVDGFRLDVFNAYFKDSELANNPLKLWGRRPFERMLHVNDIDQPEMMPLLAEVRQVLDLYPQRYAVGETFLGGPGSAAQYVGENKLHAAFDFDFLNCHWRPSDFVHAIQRWESELPAEAWPSYVLNNHDNPRSSTRYVRGEGDALLKTAAALLLTQRGTPFLYYGEEIGLRDISLPRSQIQDPIGRRYWPIYKGRDGCRAPMQWSAEQNAGFCPAGVKPWLPVHSDFPQRNVAVEQDDPASLFNFYRRLIRLRRESAALRLGMFIPLTFGTRYVMGYLRQLPGETVLVALNFSRRKQKLVLGGMLAAAGWELLLSSHHTQLPVMPRGLLPLEGNEAMLLRMK